MFYIYLNNNKVAVKVATCFFTQGSVEFVEYNNI